MRAHARANEPSGSDSLADDGDGGHRLSVRRILLGLFLTATVVLVAIILAGGRADDRPAAAGSTQGANYLVRSGDTSSSVAHLHGVSTDRFLEANDLTLSDSLDPGSRLTIPSLLTEGDRRPRELTADDDKLTYQPFFEQTTEDNDLPPGLLEALAWHESGWVNAAVGEDGRTGLGQLRPEIVSFLRREVVVVPLDPRQPEDNVALTGAYLGHLLNGSDGDQAAALAGYYMGLETYAGGIWGLDVVGFVREVLVLAPGFSASTTASTTTIAAD